MRKIINVLLLLFLIASVVSCTYDCSLDGHLWDDGEITIAATSETEGKRTYTCEKCRECAYETIPVKEVDNGIVYEKDGNKYINYGFYPQSHVSDSILIEKLNQLSEVNEKGYYEYNGYEYAKITAIPSQYGIYSFNDLFGNEYSHIYEYSDGVLVEYGAIEWFRVEPIKWIIISENTDGSNQIFSKYILDTVKYFDYRIFGEDATGFVWNEYVDEFGNYIQTNNYRYSNVRAWLNGYSEADYRTLDYSVTGFYNLAFSDVEKNTILITEVDNSVKSTGFVSNDYACENTFDKLYLLSCEEINSENSILSDSLKYTNVTDYAKATGSYWMCDFVVNEWTNNGCYWTRSPFTEPSSWVVYIDSRGEISSFEANTEIIGVRMACNIALN